MAHYQNVQIVENRNEDKKSERRREREKTGIINATQPTLNRISEQKSKRLKLYVYEIAVHGRI